MIPEHYEAFELGLFGGPLEHQYREMRPEVEAMPWGTVAASLHEYDDAVVHKARKIWTMAAFQEYRTGASVAFALQQLIDVRAPLDLIAVATRFPLDEVVHVELCSRLLHELGGAMTLMHNPDAMTPPIDEDLEPLVKCAETIIRVFCVGEAVSIPILRSSAHHSTHPLTKAILSRIALDEAMLGQFGWFFLDWCLEAFVEKERHYLKSAAHDEIGKLLQAWDRFAEPSAADIAQDRLGWMNPKTYYQVAHQALDDAVIKPFVKRNMDPRDIGPIEGHPVAA